MKNKDFRPLLLYFLFHKNDFFFFFIIIINIIIFFCPDDLRKKFLSDDHNCPIKIFNYNANICDKYKITISRRLH